MISSGQDTASRHSAVNDPQQTTNIINVKFDRMEDLLTQYFDKQASLNSRDFLNAGVSILSTAIAGGIGGALMKVGKTADKVVGAPKFKNTKRKLGNSVEAKEFNRKLMLQDADELVKRYESTDKYILDSTKNTGNYQKKMQQIQERLDADMTFTEEFALRNRITGPEHKNKHKAFAEMNQDIQVYQNPILQQIQFDRLQAEGVKRPAYDNILNDLQQHEPFVNRMREVNRVYDQLPENKKYPRNRQYLEHKNKFELLHGDEPNRLLLQDQFYNDQQPNALQRMFGKGQQNAALNDEEAALLIERPDPLIQQNIREFQVQEAGDILDGFKLDLYSPLISPGEMNAPQAQKPKKPTKLKRAAQQPRGPLQQVERPLPAKQEMELQIELPMKEIQPKKLEAFGSDDLKIRENVAQRDKQRRKAQIAEQGPERYVEERALLGGDITDIAPVLQQLNEREVNVQQMLQRSQNTVKQYARQRNQVAKKLEDIRKNMEGYRRIE